MKATLSNAAARSRPLAPNGSSAALAPDVSLTARRNDPLLSLVVPVFNEEQAVLGFVPAVRACLRQIPEVRLEIVFVNDGSQDATLARLLEIQQVDPAVCVIDLSRNFGKEAALTAGLDHCRGDIVAPMDVDLQDPPQLLPEMIAAWRQGFDVVLAQRTARREDSWLKRCSAAAFYRLHNAVSEPEIAANVGDFRLMDRAVVDVLKQLPESRRFMKGLFAWAGFISTTVGYERPPRRAGKTKFNGWKLWNLALEGFTSFSTAPLRIWTYVGASVALLSFSYAFYLMIRTIVFGADVPGYASMFVAVAFFGGLQLIGIGILGEYMGRVYMEAKRRPVYIARNVYRSEQGAAARRPAAMMQPAARVQVGVEIEGQPDAVGIEGAAAAGFLRTDVLPGSV